MDPLRNFGFLLKDVSRLIAKNFERNLAELDWALTLDQCRALFYLERNQGITQVNLAQLADLDPMTLVRILDRMEQDGWLERRPDPDDRRVRRLHLRPEAAPVIEQLHAVADRARSQSLAGLSAADRSKLVALLEQVHANLAALVPGALELGQRRGLILDANQSTSSVRASRSQVSRPTKKVAP
jgi:DNA-binding MarR family transcriptional regulator